MPLLTSGKAAGSPARANTACARSRTHSSARCERHDGQDHLLRAHPAVQERAAVARLVLTQLGGIHEEVVLEREQVVRGQFSGWKAQTALILHPEYRRWRFRTQIQPE